MAPRTYHGPPCPAGRRLLTRRVATVVSAVAGLPPPWHGSRNSTREGPGTGWQRPGKARPRNGTPTFRQPPGIGVRGPTHEEARDIAARVDRDPRRGAVRHHPHSDPFERQGSSRAGTGGRERVLRGAGAASAAATPAASSGGQAQGGGDAAQGGAAEAGGPAAEVHGAG